MGRNIQILRVGPLTPSSTLPVDSIRQIQHSISVLTADTTSEAVEILESRSIDCVMYEPAAEAEHGFDMIRQIRENNPTLPVFLVVDGPENPTDEHTTEQTVEAALRTGVTDCIIPPLSAADRRLLANRIQRAIETNRKQPTADRRPPAGSDRRLPTEADYRSLVEDVLNVSYVGTFVLDADFDVVWINDSIARYFGVESEIVGQDKRTLIEGRLKYIFEDPARFADRVIATYDDNTYVEQFECHVMPNGDRQERWLEHWSYPITSGPYEGGRIEHYVDITARKQQERELADQRAVLDRLFETAPASIVLLDSDGEIIRANTHSEVVLGRVQSALTDRRYDDPHWKIHDATGEPIPSDQLPFAIAKQTGEPVFGYEHGITLADGTDRWLSINASPLMGADGSVDRVICVVSDLTAVRESERTLTDHNAQLEEFASIVSHDLRNPLNVLAGSLELAKEKAESVHFERSMRAVTRMDHLIDDLLLLARTGAKIDATEPVDVGQLARECWQNVSAESASLQIETEAVVIADASRLAQLFENLFRNSVEHGSTSSRAQPDDSVEHSSTNSRPQPGDSVEGGSTVTITLGDCADGIFVADNGPGIPAEHRERLFEHGFTTTRQGTGLGLYIVDQIAEAHGWDVRLAETTVGTRIELTGLEGEHDHATGERG